MKDTKHALERMLFYCETVENIIVRFGNSFESFSTDTAYQLACDMAVLQIGELSTHLSAEFKFMYNDIPWKEIRGLRNYLAHDYDAIELEEQWKTITHSIPNLKKSCEKLLQHVERDAQIADALAYLNQLDAPTAAQALRQDASRAFRTSRNCNSNMLPHGILRKGVSNL